MAFRVLTLMMLVLLLALPHPGSRVAVADHAAMGHGPMDEDPPQGPKHRNLTCVALCTGSPLIEAPRAIAPRGIEFALWAGFGLPLLQALATPATLSRPPDAPVPA